MTLDENRRPGKGVLGVCSRHFICLLFLLRCCCGSRALHVHAVRSRRGSLPWFCLTPTAIGRVEMAH